MKRSLILFFLLLLYSISAMCQIPPLIIDDSEIESLRAEFNEDKIVIYTLITEYEFGLNELNGKITAKKSYIVYYLNLGGKVESIFDFNTYDDFSTIGKISGISEFESGKIDIDGIFHHDFYYAAYEINALEPNRTYPVEYEKHYSDTRYLTSEYFQTIYPIVNRKIVFRIPHHIKIELMDVNFKSYNIDKHIDNGEKEKVISYALNHIKAFPGSNNLPGKSHYAPHILILSKEANTENENENIVVMRNTQDQYDWYMQLVKQTNNNSSELKEIVTEINLNNKSDFEKMKALFYWVQDNIKYIAYEDGIAGFMPESCQDVYYNRYGDCKGMANLLTQMLKIEGIDARLTWIGTNQIVYDYSIPSLAVDNHMICTVIIDEEYFFLDATEKYIDINDNAERIQGRPILVENGESYLLKKIPEYTNERNKVLIIMEFEFCGDLLCGTIEESYSGESNIWLKDLYHSNYDDYKNQTLKELIVAGDNNITVDSINAENFYDKGKTIRLNSYVHIKNKINRFGNSLYLDWDLYKEFDYLVIDSTRKIDFVLYRKILNINTTHYKTPEDYKITSYPDNLLIENDEFIISVDFDYSESNHSIKISKKIQFPKGKISVENFDQWNNALNTLVKDCYENLIIYEKI